jgi:hypothetical protein
MVTGEGMETFHANGAVEERPPSQETPEIPPELLAHTTW